MGRFNRFILIVLYDVPGSYGNVALMLIGYVDKDIKDNQIAYCKLRVLYVHVPLISQKPAIFCPFRSPPCLLPLPPSLSLSLSLYFLIATVNKESAGFPQALKESLTLHSHNHFRPGCLGRHFHWDLPDARCRPNQTAELKKKKKRKRINLNSETKKCESDRGA